MKIALIADTHLSDRAPQCIANWHAAARAVGTADPDLTIHLGDITLDGEQRPEDIAFAATLMHAWPSLLYSVPGNHDMGSGSGEAPLSSQRLSLCTTAFGADHWCLNASGWTLVGLNAQLFGTGSTQESEQRDWLADTARRIPEQEPVALFLHRPIRRPAIDRAMPTGRYVPAEWAKWLLKGPLQRHLRLVVSGHTHQALDFVAEHVRHVWVPSTGFVLSDDMQQPVGRKVVGIGWLEIDADDCVYEQLTPPGCIAHELTRLPFYRATAPCPLR